MDWIFIKEVEKKVDSIKFYKNFMISEIDSGSEFNLNF